MIDVRKLLVLSLLAGSFLRAQTPPPTTDVLGVHDLGNGMGKVRGQNTNACIYCHAPHNALSSKPLWNQTLSTEPYTSYTSGTLQNTTSQPAVNQASVLCLSCHDGSVAVGQTVATGTFKITGTMDVLGTKLQGSHPFSLQPPIKDSANLVATLSTSHTTKDAAVLMVKDNVECSTCHDVHNQFRDRYSQEFLVRDNSEGKLCLACHETAARSVNGHDNSLSLWPNSVHAKSTDQLAPKAGVGGYPTVGESGCSTCHIAHNAAGPGLLRKNLNPPPNVDDTAQACFTCHDGSNNLVQPVANVLADFQKIGHPFSDSNNPHALGEAVVLDRNRHATCADCHNAHGATATLTFNATGELRPSQAGVSGVRADGTAVPTASFQYENCLRCHGNSENKQSLPAFGYMPARALNPGDHLNVLLEFSIGAPSSHPVIRDATRQAQPSLLNYMWDVTGKVQTRPIGTRILCTDCHNSDTNREFGGAGPNGPHGSKYDHILERAYLISTVNAGVFPGGGPGSLISNLRPSPTVDPVSSPYAMCAKCHDLTNVMTNASFPRHGEHVTAGISCSVCHSSHGVPAGTSGVSGLHLINFDLNVVAPNNGALSYSGNGTCTLTCHMMSHNADGTVKPAM